MQHDRVLRFEVVLCLCDSSYRLIENRSVLYFCSMYEVSGGGKTTDCIHEKRLTPQLNVWPLNIGVDAKTARHAVFLFL